jgi:quinoprotein glucose dehydrogenase
MAKGVLYATAGTRRSVVALDAATGELLWVHGENEGRRGQSAPRQLSGRGLAYWTDGGSGPNSDERILYVTPGYQLVALNAKTGNRVPTFGKDGVIDLKTDDDQVIDPLNSEIGLHATPVVAKDVVIVGAAHKPGGIPTSKNNVKGYVRGFDVKSGKRLWLFHTIPKPGEFGFDTWEKDAWSYTGNAGVWAQITVDEETNTVYLPVELPTGDYYGGHRPGAGLFGETLLAVDLHTGVRKWHYQLVHHGIWDMDIPCAPILTEVTMNGRTIKAVAQPTKQAILYVFDRATGQPIWPIVEKPVEKGDVPGEWYSPTQPMPTKPPAYDRDGVLKEDLLDFTPELRAEAEKIAARYKLGPIFTPPVVSKWEGPMATLTLGTSTGGTNWAGGAYDPETHIVYVPSQTALSPLGLIPGDPKRTDFAYMSGTARPPADAPPPPAAGDEGRGVGEGPGGGGLTVRGLPLLKPPYGIIAAIDLNKGEILWKIAHGETPDSIRNHPALKGLTIPRTGQSGVGMGTLVTKTLLVSGERQFTTTSTGQRGAMLRAYDKATGNDLGAVYLPAPQTGSPMTYMLNGRQYIVLAIAGQGFPAELIAFRLSR